MSDGGPKLDCDYRGKEDISYHASNKRSLAIDTPMSPVLDKRQMNSDAANFLNTTIIPSTTQTELVPHYKPEPWGPGATVAFTTTIKSLIKLTYTTEIVLASTGVSSSSPISQDGISGLNRFIGATLWWFGIW